MYDFFPSARLGHVGRVPDLVRVAHALVPDLHENHAAAPRGQSLQKGEIVAHAPKVHAERNRCQNPVPRHHLPRHAVHAPSLLPNLENHFQNPDQNLRVTTRVRSRNLPQDHLMTRRNQDLVLGHHSSEGPQHQTTEGRTLSTWMTAEKTPLQRVMMQQTTRVIERPIAVFYFALCFKYMYFFTGFVAVQQKGNSTLLQKMEELQLGLLLIGSDE